MGRGARTFNRVLLWVLLGVVVAVLIFTGWMFYRAATNESVDFKRGSLDYEFFMQSSFIEGIDTGECEASYYFMLGEGDEDVYGVELTHSKFPEIAIDALRKYIDGVGGCPWVLGFNEGVKQEGERGGYYNECVGAVGWIGVRVEEYGGVWKVYVSHEQ